MVELVRDVLNQVGSANNRARHDIGVAVKVFGTTVQR
jgi:hypothetical protein